MVIRVIKLAFMFGILVSILWYFRPFAMYKSKPKEIQRWTNLYEAPSDYYDTFIVGSSHAGQDINPYLLDYIFGTRSLNVFTRGESIFQSYHHIKEILRLHKPRNIVLELYSLAFDQDTINYTPAVGSFDLLRFSPNKIQYVFDLVKPENRWDYLFPVFREHDFWKKHRMGVQLLDRPVFRFDHRDNGNLIRNHSRLSKDKVRRFETWEYELPQTTLNGLERIYLKKIFSMVQTEGVNLVLIMCPVYDPYYHKSGFESLVDSITELCLNENVPFVDLNRDFAIRSNPKLFHDEKKVNVNQHLNVFGATKSTYLLSNEILKRKLEYGQYKRSKSQKLIREYNRSFLKQFDNFPTYLKNLEISHHMVMTGKQIKHKNLAAVRHHLHQMGARNFYRKPKNPNAFGVVFDFQAGTAKERFLDDQNEIVFENRGYGFTLDDEQETHHVLDSSIFFPSKKGWINVSVINHPSSAIIDQFSINTDNQELLLIRER
jgi:hypothetical protein